MVADQYWMVTVDVMGELVSGVVVKETVPVGEIVFVVKETFPVGEISPKHSRTTF